MSKGRTMNSNGDKETNPPLESEPLPPGMEKCPPMEITILDVELDQLQKDVKEFKDKYLRLLAENENTRKRLQKEKQDLIKYAVQSLVVDLLSPLDHLETALNASNQMNGEVKHWAAGFHMILQQLKDTLSSHGVEAFSSEGKNFDPHLHEAVEMVETSDFPEGVIIKEFVKGYRLGDRIIRPARVKVSKKMTRESSEESSKDLNK